MPVMQGILGFNMRYKPLLKEIKKHIDNEIVEYKKYLNSDYQDSFQDALFQGRNEYAESLLNQIKEWENTK